MQRILHRQLAGTFAEWRSEAAEAVRLQALGVIIEQDVRLRQLRELWTAWRGAYKRKQLLRGALQKLAAGSAIRVLRHWQVVPSLSSANLSLPHCPTAGQSMLQEQTAAKLLAREMAKQCCLRLLHWRIGKAFMAWQAWASHTVLLRARAAPLLARWRLRTLSAAFQGFLFQVTVRPAASEMSRPLLQDVLLCD